MIFKNTYKAAPIPSTKLVLTGFLFPLGEVIFSVLLLTWVSTLTSPSFVMSLLSLGWFEYAENAETAEITETAEVTEFTELFRPTDERLLYNIKIIKI